MTATKTVSQSLKKLNGLLPSPASPLQGRKAPPFVLPDNIICFSRHDTADLNHPPRSRMLHHRFVLMLALEASATVRIDDHEVRLDEGHGLFVFPFQFHDFIGPETGKLDWLFITFDLPNDGSLAAMHYRAFAITPEMRRAAEELVVTYVTTKATGEANLVVALQLALLLLRIRQANPGGRRTAEPVSLSPGLATRVSRIAEATAQMPTAKEIAATLGISASHLRVRFRESCGVSLGKHLRRLRMEKARGLLRMSTRRVSEVADVCGFSSVYTFSRAFRALYGVSPLEYRKGGSVRF